MTGKFYIFANERSDHQTSWGGAFARGLQRHGWSGTVGMNPGRCDLLVMWGVRRVDLIARQKTDDRDVCILERGYVGDRFAWTSVSFGGGLNGRGEFRGEVDDGSRWRTHFGHLMQPWRRLSEGYALIMQQVPGDAAVVRADLPRFYTDAEHAFAGQMPVRMRAHPNAHPRLGAEKMAAAKVSLASDLAGAALAVTWNSNSAVDAVLAGVPAIALDRGSMAWDVSGHELRTPPMPDRTAWAHALAWKQWRLDEISSGECWSHIHSRELADG